MLLGKNTELIPAGWKSGIEYCYISYALCIHKGGSDINQVADISAHWSYDCFP